MPQKGENRVEYNERNSDRKENIERKTDRKGEKDHKGPIQHNNPESLRFHYANAYFKASPL